MLDINIERGPYNLPALNMSGFNENQTDDDRDRLGRQIIDASPIAQCVVDENRNIRLANTAFQVIARHCNLSAYTSRLMFHHADSDDIIQRAILATLTTGKSGSVRIPVFEKTCLSVTVSPLSMTNFVLLTLMSPQDDLIDSQHLHKTLRLKWSLTHCEAECALLLGQGKTARDIAQERGVSLPTIRTQMQAIREKLGVKTPLKPPL